MGCQFPQERYRRGNIINSLLPLLLWEFPGGLIKEGAHFLQGVVCEVGGAALKLGEEVLLGNATGSARLECEVHQPVQGCGYPCREVIDVGSEEVHLEEGRERKGGREG